MNFVRFVSGLLLLTSVAAAQSTNPPSPYPMPGTVVGKPAPVGTAFPKAAQPNGAPVGNNGPNGQPVNAGQRPSGQLINLNNLAAPLPAPLPPDLSGQLPKTYLERKFDEWKAMLGFSRPTSQPMNWTPGLSRRNKDRREAKTAWQRD